MKPILRFTNFDNDWEEIELLKIASEISYGMNAASKEYDGENKYIRITDIDEQTNKYTHKNIVSPDGDLEEKFLVKENDILFARTGASTGKTYLYDKNDGKLYYAGFLIKANIINHNANFIFQQTKLNKYNNWVKIMSMRSGQPGINSQEYGSYKFSITSPKEENKVSNFLSLLDKKIELQSKKIEDLKLFKKGLIKDFYNEYNLRQIKIKEIGKIVTGTTPSKSINSYWDNGNITWVTPTDINDSRDINDSFFKITDKGLNKGKFIPKNAVLVTCIASIGKNAVLKVDGSCNQQINAIIPNKNFNYNYVYYLIESISNYMKSIAGTSATSIINKEEFSKIIVKVHSKEKQDYIASVLSQFEIKILLEISKLNKFYQLKKGLMQNMFV